MPSLVKRGSRMRSLPSSKSGVGRSFKGSSTPVFGSWGAIVSISESTASMDVRCRVAPRRIDSLQEMWLDPESWPSTRVGVKLRFVRGVRDGGVSENMPDLVRFKSVGFGPKWRFLLPRIWCFPCLPSFHSALGRDPYVPEHSRTDLKINEITSRVGFSQTYAPRERVWRYIRYF